MSVEKPSKGTGVQFSLRYKLLIGFTLIFSLVFAVAYYWFYQYSTTMAMNRIHDDLHDTLKGALAGIDGDEFESLVQEAQPDESGVPSQDERYNKHQDWLMTIYNIEPRAYNTYTYVKGSQTDEVLWVGDNYRVILPDVSTKFLESYIRTPDSLIMEGFIGETINMEIYQDPWGEHVSAYGPIRNSKDLSVGALGIDFRAEYVRQVQAGIRNSMVLSFVMAYAALFALVYLVSRYLTSPITRLTVAAERVGEGDYEQDFTSLTQDKVKDEIDVLASSFASMVDKVYQRELTLRRQVEELRIEIDETKRRSQVSEIVETDFFRDLQAKADHMRTRRGIQLNDQGES
ncbi:MAG: HAMP domain-containing protein [Anaerolineales bacterium]|nr:HAMP domain-containing protein [Anaerolineales bacterium]